MYLTFSIPIIFHDFSFKFGGEIQFIHLLNLAEINARLPDAPTLEKVFQTCPSSLGFNIEIKYPTVQDNINVLPRQKYLDYIFDIIRRFKEKRVIFISSFDHLICKQVPYEFDTFLLSHGSIFKENPRSTDCLEIAMQKAKASKLKGIVSHSKPLLISPSVVQFMKSHDMFVYTWGETNNQIENVSFQLRHGIDAIITDDVFSVSKTFESL